jgi:LPS sulfotransferase NodH
LAAERNSLFLHRLRFRIIFTMDAALQAFAEWVLYPTVPAQPTPCESSYFVCGTPRCGTWLLCGLLTSTGVAGRPHEWFWRNTEDANRRAWGVSDFPEYLARVREAGTTPNGVFGSKLMWAQVEELLPRLKQADDSASHAALIAQHFPSPHFIWVQREDIAAQAVSWAKAIQTGHWHHWDTASPLGTPVYNRDEIDALAAEVAASNAAWRAWFAANDIEPLAVRFEHVSADPAAVTRGVLEFLGIETNAVSVTELTVSTSDRVNEKWLARYRA